MMMIRLAILSVFFGSLATTTVALEGVPTRDVDLLTTEDGSELDRLVNVCNSELCSKPPGCASTCGRRLVSFSDSAQGRSSGGPHHAAHLMTEHNWPESDALQSGRRIVSFSASEQLIEGEDARNSKPPGCITGNECECGGRTCAYIPKTTIMPTTAKEHGARLVAQLEPQSEQPSGGACASGYCGSRPPGCVTGNECECYSKVCASFPKSSTTASDTQGGAACANGICNKPPGCVTGKECECHSRNCITFPEVPPSDSTMPQKGGRTRWITEAEKPSESSSSSSKPKDATASSCATGFCGKPPGCVTGKECECHSRRCVGFSDSSTTDSTQAATQECDAVGI